MPILKAEGDILKSGATFIVIPVNTVGVMGAGLAAQVKPILMRSPLIRRLGSAPTGWAEYLNACANNEAFKACQDIVDYAHIDYDISAGFVFFPTKQDWRKPSRLEWVKSGLNSLRAYLKDVQTLMQPSHRTVAIPALGCGLGGLCWGDVEEAIENTLGGLDEWTIMVYPPK